MFPNWTGWTYIKASLFTLITFDGIFMTANVFSAATVHYATIASLLLGGAGVVVTTLSGTSMGPALVRNAPKVLPLALLLGASSLLACTNGQLPPAVVVSLNTATCLLDTYSADIAKGESIPAATADAAAHCLVPLLDAQKLLEAHHAAEVRELAAAAGDAGAP